MGNYVGLAKKTVAESFDIGGFTLKVLLACAVLVIIAMGAIISYDSGWVQVGITPCEHESQLLQKSCPHCGQCLPTIGVGSIVFGSCECDCCNIERWEYKCRNTGEWFSAEFNECDRIVWGTNSNATEKFLKKLEDGKL